MNLRRSHSRARTVRLVRGALLATTGLAFLAACAAESAAPKKKKKPFEPGDDWYADETPGEELPLQPAFVNEDSGAFGAPERPRTDAGADAGDAGQDGGPVVKKPCRPPLVAGDLVIVELLLSSRSGSGDEGEWIEVQSTRTDCWLDVQGISVESPRGAVGTNVAKIETPLSLPPRGTFLAVDTLDPLKNHHLKGPLVAFSAADVLKNDGDAVSVKLGATLIDSVTYPRFANIEPGRALAFPSDCASSLRSTWARWSLAFNRHDPNDPTQRGTPNAANDDVTCF